MTPETKVFIGGSGKLGRAFFAVNPDYLYPTHSILDITNSESLERYFDNTRPGIVIHAAAVVGKNEAERNRDRALKVNVEGTRNIVNVCIKYLSRLIFISSVAVYGGKNEGNYSESDTPNPQYFYGTTKLLAEQEVTKVPNSVIIRTDFFDPSNLKYNNALSDHYCSKIPVTSLVPILGRIADSNFVGIINVGIRRETLYSIVKRYLPHINPILIKDSVLPDFPKDLSMDVSLMERLFSS